MERVRERLKLVVPITLFIIVLLLYMNTKSAVKTFIVLLAVPFSAVGAIWFLHLLGYNMSIGVWVGLIALLGVDAETGVFMLLYLDLAYEDAKRNGRLRNLGELRQAILHGAVKRDPAEVHDGGDYIHRAGAHHVGDRRGSGRDEAHRGACDWRCVHVVPHGTGGVSGDLRGMEMAFRFEAAALGLLIAVRLSADVTLPVRHDHLRGAGGGRLAATAEALEFTEETGKKDHSWRLRWDDIQQLWIGAHEVRVLTYADSRWRLGEDREYTLEAEKGTTFEALAGFARERMDRRVVTAIPEDVQQPLWEVPVKLKKGFGGSEGVLAIGTNTIVYRSEEKDESRTWQVSDIDNIATSGPFDFTITTFEGRSYTFHFKRPLDERQYQALWRRLNASKQAEVLR